jgi:hypothetical protein
VSALRCRGIERKECGTESDDIERTLRCGYAEILEMYRAIFLKAYMLHGTHLHVTAGAARARCRARDFDRHRSSRRRNNCGVSVQGGAREHWRCGNGALKRHDSIVDIRKDEMRKLLILS